MDPAVERGREVDLAALAEFRLGAAEVSPSTCRVRISGAEQRLEPRVMQVLVVLARRVGQTVTRDELIEACWGGRIVSDDAVNRVIAQVRAVSRTAEAAGFALATVPKVGVRLVLEPAGAGAPAGVAAPRPALGRPRAVRLAALSALVIGLGAVATAVAFWRSDHPPERPAWQNGRVEVMRYEARSSEAETQRLAAQVGDALIRRLTRAGIDTLPQLAAKDAGGGPDGAEFRVAGSVERRGADVVIGTHVIDRRSGMVLGAYEETRPAGSLQRYPEQIAAAVSGTLECALEDRGQSRRAMDPRVFAQYLNACDALAREGNATRMLQALRRLITAKPDLAIAHALYAIAQARAAEQMEHSPEGEAVLWEGARASASRALALDPRTPKAYIALALADEHERNWVSQEANLLKVREIDPNMGPGQLSYISLLRNVGRLREAAEIAEQVWKSGDARVEGGGGAYLVLIEGQLGRTREAHRDFDQIKGEDPEGDRHMLWELASDYDPPAQALAELRALGPEGIEPESYACVLRVLGGLASQPPVRSHGLPPVCDRVAPMRRIVLLAREGDVDGAYLELERMQHAGWPRYADLFDVNKSALRADPRFMAFAARVGLADYWIRSGHWPDFCAEPGLPYDCKSAARAALASIGATPR